MPARLSPVRLSYRLGLLLLLVAGLWPLAGQAQPLRPGLQLTEPTERVANRLNLLRGTDDEPAVALLYSELTAEQVPGADDVVSQAVRQWELLLLGLGLPYRVLSDRDLERGLDDEVRVLILPAAEALSRRQRRSVRRFMDDGGGLIASGRVGHYDDRGRTTDDDLFGAWFGAEYVETGLPEQPAGILHTLDGGHAVTAGLPMGYRLNLSPQRPISAARPTTSTAVGDVVPYLAGDASFFADLTFVLEGRYREGRFVWTRFHPQDVSREPEQQAVYQAFAINALAYAAGVATVAVQPWPAAHPSATVLAALPAVGFDALAYAKSMTLLLDALDAAEAPATFFLTAREAAAFPDLLARMGARGELGVSSTTSEMLFGLPYVEQLARLEAAQQLLDAPATDPIIGLYPPGNFHDVNTDLAMVDAGLQYLLSADPPRAAVPYRLDWWQQADYRAPLLTLNTPEARQTLAVDGRGLTPEIVDAPLPGTPAYERRRTDAPVATDRTAPTDVERLPGPVLVMPIVGRDDTALDAADLASQEATYAAFLGDFTQVHEAHGLYVLPFHPTGPGFTAERAAAIAAVAETAAERGTWLTTLRDVHTWWMALEQVDVTLNSLTEDAAALTLLNESSATLEGLTLTLYLPRPARRDRVRATGAEAEVTLGDNGRRLTLVLPSLRPGTTRLSLELD